MLIVAERTKDGLINLKTKEMIEKMDDELTDIIEDFMRAVDVEALGIVKKTGTCPLSECGNYSR